MSLEDLIRVDNKEIKERTIQSGKEMREDETIIKNGRKSNYSSINVGRPCNESAEIYDTSADDEIVND